MSSKSLPIVENRVGLRKVTCTPNEKKKVIDPQCPTFICSTSPLLESAIRQHSAFIIHHPSTTRYTSIFDYFIIAHTF